MGNEMSAEERRELREKCERLQRERKERCLEDFVSKLKEGPDVGINRNIVTFTGLASSDALRRHYERRRAEVGDHAADWVKSLAEKLSHLTASPELTGLGALAIAVLIDMISSSPPEESTKDALRGVFAEEKASEVWDHIDECLKRYRMNIHCRDELKSDMRHIELKLSAALTRLKNAMLRDGLMTTDGLRAWVNGAAFHIQMLIQLVRLGWTQTCGPVEEALSTYERELSQLFRKHREMVDGKCRQWRHCNYHTGVESRQLRDESSKWHKLSTDVGFEEYLEAYYERRYGRQKREDEQYFRGVRRDLQHLVRQTGSFVI